MEVSKPCHSTVYDESTLGVNTTYKGQYCLLSATHGLTHVNRANLRKEINTQSDSSEDYQPMGTTIEDQMDFVLYNSPQVPSPKYAKQDLAWATVTQE